MGAPDSIAALLPSWRQSLAARRISPRTVVTYTTSVEQLAAYPAAHGMPAKVGAIRREHVEAFVADLLTTRAPATAYPGTRPSRINRRQRASSQMTSSSVGATDQPAAATDPTASRPTVTKGEGARYDQDAVRTDRRRARGGR